MAQSPFEPPEMRRLLQPWDNNPSRWRSRIPVCILASIAAVIAAYLALYQWRLIPDVWDPVFGDQSKRVLDSDVSHQIKYWTIIPDAALGVMAYLGDAIFGLAGSTRRWHTRPWLVILFGIDVILLGIVSSILMALQGFVVGYWCFLCLVTGVLSLTMVFMAFNEVRTCLVFLYRVWKKTNRFDILWQTLWGRATEEAHETALEMMRSEYVGARV